MLAEFPHEAPLLGAVALAVDAAHASTRSLAATPSTWQLTSMAIGGHHPHGWPAGLLMTRASYAHFRIEGLTNETHQDPRGPLRCLPAGRRLWGWLIGGSSSGGSSGGSSNSTLTIDNESGSLWTCNFNPFNLSDIGYSLGPVYEPLMFVNTLQSAKTTPWLATATAWTNGNKTLTFTIRNGVKWSDGKPMTAADVVFTFNLLKKFKALDLNAVWSVLSSVTQKGSDQVVMTFKQPAVTYFYYIADQVAIVPAAHLVDASPTR